MKLFTYCQFHPREKIFVDYTRWLGKEPSTRSEVPFSFTLVCPQGFRATYTNHQLQAEVGLAPLGGAVLGGLLFLIDPVLGIIGAIGGAVAGASSDQAKVDKFNRS